jgi:perosamine synthetase
VKSNIPLSCANITDREIRAASDALSGEQLALGPWTHRFEQSVATHAGSNFGVATSSSHSAIQVTLESLNIGKGDEVILPSFAFPAAAATVIRLGATPVFSDCDPRTLNMDANDVSTKISEDTKAIIASHTFGNPSGIDAISRIAQEQEVPLIEDAGQAIGSKLNSRQVGSFGRVAIFAFHSTSQLTSVDGGVIVTDDDGLAQQCKLRRNHGLASDPTMTTDELHRVRTDELMIAIGHGFRLSEVHAAVGTVQMKRLPEIMERRDLVAQWYTRRLGGLAELTCPTVDSGVEMSWDGFVVRLSDNFTKEERDEVIRGLHRHDIGAADFFQSIPTIPVFSKYSQDAQCPVAESISQRTIALPFYTSMTQNEVDIVSQTLELMLTRGSFSTT